MKLLTCLLNQTGDSYLDFFILFYCEFYKKLVDNRCSVFHFEYMNTLTEI